MSVVSEDNVLLRNSTTLVQQFCVSDFVWKNFLAGPIIRARQNDNSNWQIKFETEKARPKRVGDGSELLITMRYTLIPNNTNHRVISGVVTNSPGPIRFKPHSLVAILAALGKIDHARIRSRFLRFVGRTIQFVVFATSHQGCPAISRSGSGWVVVLFAQ